MAGGQSSMLRSRRFLVTGGARGIGATVAATLAAHGADGAIIDLASSPAQAGPWPVVSADVTDETAMRDAVAALTADGAPFDGLVAAAGIVPAWHSPADVDLAVFDRPLTLTGGPPYAMDGEFEFGGYMPSGVTQAGPRTLAFTLDAPADPTGVWAIHGQPPWLATPVTTPQEGRLQEG